MVVGDFNDFSSTSERRNNARDSNGRNHCRLNKFNDNLDICGLMDLGSCGPRMTWTNGRFGLTNMLVRLDRALANANWRAMFPEATVRVLPRTYSTITLFWFLLTIWFLPLLFRDVISLCKICG